MPKTKSDILIGHFEELIKNPNSSLIELKNSLKDVYNSLKVEHSSLSYEEYRDLLRRVQFNEDVLTRYAITSAKTNLNLEEINKNRIEELKRDILTVKGILNYIMMQCRYYITRKYLNYTYHPYAIKNYDDIDLTNMCYDISKLINSICSEINIKCQTFRLNVGFVKIDDIHLINNKSFHYFCVIKIGTERYLIDLTYKQFFTLYKNIPSRLGVVDMDGCYPGIYMLSDESRKQTAELLITQGWIPFSDENVKNYFDGFALSYRNGLYYEHYGFDNLSTIYTKEDYERFLDGEDDQFRHEKEEYLSTQRIPLNNPKLVFKKDEI